MYFIIMFFYCDFIELKLLKNIVVFFILNLDYNKIYCNENFMDVFLNFYYIIFMI